MSLESLAPAGATEWEPDLFGVDQRQERLDRLVADARQLLRDTIQEYVFDARDRWGRIYHLSAICVLYSGGNDSTVLAHLFRDMASHAIHANTGIGIEETRQFVRDTCAGWGLPLIEKHPPMSYEELVVKHGFPGPAHHWKMYQRLKERCLRAAKRDLMADPHRERVIFLAGRRSAESQRRTTRTGDGEMKPVERDGSAIWVSPLLHWTALDLNTYRERFPDCPRNPVADHLHMSGECLCGSFAKPGELDEIGFFYPEVKQQIADLEGRVRAAGNVSAERCRWGWGADRDRTSARSGRMCSSCVQTPLFDVPSLTDSGEISHTPKEASA